ncbi:MAG TPA: GatB/YqeY domain-containing protein, partial [Abditibacteriaceae bacterium]|nr:GatB/YqeY domain-containing protein [Abditibacteriaceae bacterium]
NLQQQLNEEWKTAMRNKDALRRDTLSGLRAAIKRAEIDARAGDGDVIFDDAQTQGVIEREAKKRRDSIDEYTKANRDDLAQKERDELAILAEFLPQQLSDEELESLVKVAVEESGAKTPKDMGVLMKTLMPRVQGRADGKRVNEVVKRLLQ